MADVASRETQVRAMRLPLSSVGMSVDLRCDAKFRLFWAETGGVLYPNGSKTESVPIKYLLHPFEARTVKPTDLDEDSVVVDLADVQQHTGQVSPLEASEEVKSNRIALGNSDVVTTGLRPYLGKTFANDKDLAMVGSPEWIPLKVNEAYLPPIVLKYALLSSGYVENSHRLLSGKEHPRISKRDLLNLRLPKFESGALERLEKHLHIIDGKISSTSKQLDNPGLLIDRIICRSLDFPLEEHKTRERVASFRQPLAELGRSSTLRASTRFNHPDQELLDAYFNGTPYERISFYLAAPIRLGVTLQRANLMVDGEALYVHPAAVRHQRQIVGNDCHQVSIEFFEANQHRSGLSSGDIVMCRSGLAIGKSAMYTLEAPALFSDFTMRVRFNDDMNAVFGWHYMRSTLFQLQIRRGMSGMGPPNIYPFQVASFKVPKLSRTQQDEIASEVDSALEAQDAMRESILAWLAEIQEAIEGCSLASH